MNRVVGGRAARAGGTVWVARQRIEDAQRLGVACGGVEQRALQHVGQPFPAAAAGVAVFAPIGGHGVLEADKQQRRQFANDGFDDVKIIGVGAIGRITEPRAAGIAQVAIQAVARRHIGKAAVGEMVQRDLQQRQQRPPATVTGYGQSQVGEGVCQRRIFLRQVAQPASAR
ncbi:hypothetical protein BZ164_01460 [Pseudomonas veronii]|nr:hypothetical protein BZ164_01460 [Pseudomonas veronii]